MEGMISFMELQDKINLREVYKLFKRKLKDFQLIPVEEEKQVDIKPYQLRLLSCSVPDYWLLVLEAERGVSSFGLYKVLVLTEDICLASFNNDVPLLRVAGVNVIACLPFWIYLIEEFLKKYSLCFGNVEKGLAEYMLRWAMWVKLPSKRSVSGRYVTDVMRLMSGWRFWIARGFLPFPQGS
jgi:hypothetical protein